MPPRRSACGPPTMGPGQTGPGSWPSSRNQSRVCGSGRARRTSTSAAGTGPPRGGSCGRPESGSEGSACQPPPNTNRRNVWVTHRNLGAAGLVNAIHVFTELGAVTVPVPVVLGHEQQSVDHFVEESLRRQNGPDGEGRGPSQRQGSTTSPPPGLFWAGA